MFNFPVCHVELCPDAKDIQQRATWLSFTAGCQPTNGFTPDRNSTSTSEGYGTLSRTSSSVGPGEMLQGECQHRAQDCSRHGRQCACTCESGNAHYIWVGFPGQASWNVFADILHKSNIETTPGNAFGPAGDSFVRAVPLDKVGTLHTLLLIPTWHTVQYSVAPLFVVVLMPCHVLTCTVLPKYVFEYVA